MIRSTPDPFGGKRRRLMASKLYVGGLSYATTSESLREYFAQCGTVESAAVVTDRFSGESRGFGFVEMSTEAEAQDAIKRLDGPYRLVWACAPRRLSPRVRRIPRPASLAGLGVLSAAVYASAVPLSARLGLEPLQLHLPVFGMAVVFYLLGLGLVGRGGAAGP